MGKKHLQSCTFTVPGHRVLQAGDKVILEFDHEPGDEGLTGATIQKIGQEQESAVPFLKEEWYGDEEEDQVEEETSLFTVPSVNIDHAVLATMSTITALTELVLALKGLKNV